MFGRGESLPIVCQFNSPLNLWLLWMITLGKPSAKHCKLLVNVPIGCPQAEGELHVKRVRPIRTKIGTSRHFKYDDLRNMVRNTLIRLIYTLRKSSESER